MLTNTTPCPTTKILCLSIYMYFPRALAILPPLLPQEPPKPTSFFKLPFETLASSLPAKVIPRSPEMSLCPVRQLCWWRWSRGSWRRLCGHVTFPGWCLVVPVGPTWDGFPSGQWVGVAGFASCFILILPFFFEYTLPETFKSKSP